MILSADLEQVPHGTGVNTPGPYSLLTAREREVVELVCEGLSDKEIGRKLEMSPNRANRHRMEAMKKTGTHKAATLVRWAIRAGLVNA